MKRYCLTNYTMQCTDETTGVKGCFLFDTEHWQQTGKFKAISPVFPDLDALYKGTTPEQRNSIYIEREEV